MRLLPTLPAMLQGATLSNLVLSGVGQVLTAGFTRFLLRKRLTNGQVGGILFVGLGLAIRAAPASYFQPDGGALGSGGSSSSQAAAAGGGLATLSPEQVQGAAMVALAALLYSLLVGAVVDVWMPRLLRLACWLRGSRSSSVRRSFAGGSQGLVCMPGARSKLQGLAPHAPESDCRPCWLPSYLPVPRCCAGCGI